MALLHNFSNFQRRNTYLKHIESMASATYERIRELETTIRLIDIDILVRGSNRFPRYLNINGFGNSKEWTHIDAHTKRYIARCPRPLRNQLIALIFNNFAKESPLKSVQFWLSHITAVSLTTAFLGTPKLAIFTASDWLTASLLRCKGTIKPARAHCLVSNITKNIYRSRLSDHVNLNAYTKSQNQIYAL